MTNTNPLIGPNPIDTVHAALRVLNFLHGASADDMDEEEEREGRSWIMDCAIRALEHHAAQLAAKSTA
jgi:hypothetical protein